MNRFVTVFYVLFLSTQVFAQVSITGIGDVSINFDSFQGDGFNPTPTAGQLDSDAWAITGMSDGDLAFGGTETTADFARGTDIDGVTTGGIYAFEVGTDDFTLGVQPTGGDFSPGTITLKLINNTGTPITTLDVEYDVWEYNDQGRSSSFNFSYSADDISYTAVASVDYTTAETAAGSPSWSSSLLGLQITGLSVSDGDFIYLRWTGNDVGGSGSRDQIALDNILIGGGDTPLPVELTSFAASAGDGVVNLKWSTASEKDNLGFVVYRGDSKEGEYDFHATYENVDALKGHGTTASANHYKYSDRDVFNGQTYWYKIMDVDRNGAIEMHGPVTATPQATFVEEGKTEYGPSEYALHQNFPNPFNPSTEISFTIPQDAGSINVSISVYKDRKSVV